MRAVVRVLFIVNVERPPTLPHTAVHLHSHAYNTGPTAVGYEAEGTSNDGRFKVTQLRCVRVHVTLKHLSHNTILLSHAAVMLVLYRATLSTHTHTHTRVFLCQFQKIV